jgi:hypothetical protein
MFVKYKIFLTITAKSSLVTQNYKDKDIPRNEVNNICTCIYLPIIILHKLWYNCQFILQNSMSQYSSDYIT